MIFLVSYKHFCSFSMILREALLLKEEVSKVDEGTSAL